MLIKKEKNGSILSINDESRYDSMKYLPLDLKSQYERWRKEFPDIIEIESPLINLSDVFRAYCFLAHYFTDESSEKQVESMLIGMRSGDLLASAIGRQYVCFGGKRKYTRDLDICATLFYGLVKDHAFADGNKRTALLILLYQLQCYGYYPTARLKDFEKLVVAVASNELNKTYRNYWEKFHKQSDTEIKTISFILKKYVTKKNHSYDINPTMRQFCDALERYGVVCEQRGSKMNLEYRSPKKWFGKGGETTSSTIPFNGWTRIVGAGTARETLNRLKIYQAFDSYTALLEKETMYELIDRFEQPLRRLKDK